MTELEASADIDYDPARDLDPELHPYSLDPQLEQDCIRLGRFSLCELLLMNDANYPWFILVPQRSDIGEIYHLSAEDQQQLMAESSRLSSNLADIFNAHKMNVAALGNMVRQLHVHHVVRQPEDPAWPAPVWGRLPSQPYSVEQIADIRERVNSMLADDSEYEAVTQD
ncbi:HIT domain-containing protein [Motiliproteus coralliicola]|uniref:HIT domain-containing protein n=1 Tax=Motiliproteus coralliicola TaxID=2283196 RepID=A0A369WTA8_9GAMM|nr:HIT domain-containing protein [Motiliproteus coralliicola]RDE24907.1 HIT domain-containing protein [Motiliproteus coralliicola]